MSEIDVNFDPLEAEIEALDEAFYNWYHSLGGAMQQENYDYLNMWNEAAHEPVTYTSDEIYEGWGNDIDEFVEVNTLVVDKRLSEEIERKKQLIAYINEDAGAHECPHCEDGTCTSLEIGE